MVTIFMMASWFGISVFNWRLLASSPTRLVTMETSVSSRAGRALDDLGGVTVDGSGEMLGQPGLGRAGFADQQRDR